MIHNTNKCHFLVSINSNINKKNDRNSCPEVLNKKGVLRNFAKFTGKHLCQSLFIKKRGSGTDVFL